MPGFLAEFDMTFAAILLVCSLTTTQPENCNESTAVWAFSKHAESELGCYGGWQEIIAGGPFKAVHDVDLDGEMYVKTLCRRNMGK